MQVSILSFTVAAIFYLAFFIFAYGLISKILQYKNTPAPLKIPTMPAPTTQAGVVFRMSKEVVFFESLFKSSKATWLFGWLFHFGLFLDMLRHLRYFIDPIWFWVLIIQPFGKYGSILMFIGLAGLLTRRIIVDRVRYISSPSDHLMLVLLLSITTTGMAMSFYLGADVISVKSFFIGLMTFDIQNIPSDPVLVSHLLMVASLMIIFPYSKLLHAPGLFFSPSRNQVDNAREKRHVAKWAEDLEKN
ncbi:MAG: nitrate reductase [Gammaproteobacteria bacterium]|jgi:nitrate reductase gamma subunit|nr:nitrate reductase [Gammaproteobacteria bacterium]|tara:strand:- start:945 stop:1682 length:738 start_codon:yes stop_codon:yes gene_type:complete